MTTIWLNPCGGRERERDRDQRVLDSILIVFFLLYLLCIFYQETNAWICPKVMAEEDCRFYWLMVVKVEASELMEVFGNALRLIKEVANVGNLMMLFLLKPSLIFFFMRKRWNFMKSSKWKCIMLHGWLAWVIGHLHTTSSVCIILIVHFLI